MANTSNKKKIVATVLYILLIILLAGAFVFCGYFTNWFKTDFVKFYVKLNGENVMQDTVGVLVGTDRTTVNVKYTFELFDKNLKGYSLKLEKNSNIDFNFSKGEEILNFQNADIDVSRLFNIEQAATSFSLSAKTTNIVDLLKLLYPTDEISLDESTAGKLAQYDLFELTIYSADKSSSIKLGLRLGNSNSSSGVILDKTEIIF